MAKVNLKMRLAGLGNSYWVKLVLKLCFALALLVWLVDKDLLSASGLKPLWNVQVILLSLALILLELAFGHWRWVSLLKAKGFGLSYLGSFRLTLIGLFFNFIIPGSVSGDVLKGYYLYKDTAKGPADVAASILVDRMMGLFSMVVVAMLPIAIFWRDFGNVSQLRYIFFSSVIFVVLFSSGVAVTLSQSLNEQKWFQVFFKYVPGFIKELYFSLHAYRNHKKTLLFGLLLSFAAQMTIVYYMIYTGGVLGFELSGWAYFFAVPIGFMVSALPLAPGGIGVGQVAFLFLFTLYTGTESQVGPSVMTAFQIALLFWALIGIVFYVQMRPGVAGRAASEAEQ